MRCLKEARECTDRIRAGRLGEAFLRDLQWCPRNFLHRRHALTVSAPHQPGALRYRLAFKDLDDIPREVGT